MPAFDRYSALGGTKHKLSTPEDVLDFVRAAWPGACQEGSTGFERSWTATVEGAMRMVAHSWSPRRDMAWFWVRIAAGADDTLDPDRPDVGSTNSRARMLHP